MGASFSTRGGNALANWTAHEDIVMRERGEEVDVEELVE